MYAEVHTAECRARSRAHGRRYREQLHRRFDYVNSVVVAAVPIVAEGEPADDAPDLSDVETERPRAIPPIDVSLAAARCFESSDYPPVWDWTLVCSWWLRRKLGLLDDQA